jgi:hypothetical protein
MIEKDDLSELKSTILTGITVGIGSIVLLFASGAHILVQCDFECGDADNVFHGHGENVDSSVELFRFLNHRVKDIDFDINLTLKIRFDGDGYLKIIPENNGLESYVLTTRHGICPVIAL